VQTHGLDGLFMCTLLAGVMLLLLGLTGLGTAVKYFPRPVVIGFTNGIAVLIASTQIKDFLGLRIDRVPGDFLGRLRSIAEHWGTVSPAAAGWGSVRCSSSCSCCASPGASRAPSSRCSSARVAWALALPLETIATSFGGIPAGLPRLQVPTFQAHSSCRCCRPRSR